MMFVCQLKRLKTLIDDKVILQMENQRLVVTENSDKLDFLQSKLMTIERHLPVMIQEILEFYFEKKVSNLVSKIVTKDEFKSALAVKLDYQVFRDYEKGVAADRT